jgi:hypothetical protein
VHIVKRYFSREVSRAWTPFSTNILAQIRSALGSIAFIMLHAISQGPGHLEAYVNSRKLSASPRVHALRSAVSAVTQRQFPGGHAQVSAPRLHADAEWIY